MKTLCPITKIFVCYQTWDFSAHAREHAPGNKYAFPVPCARGLDIFQNNSHSSNLGRSSDELLAITMLTPTAQRQKLALIISTLKLLAYMRSTSLRHVVDVTADANHMLLFCVGNQALLNKMYCSYGKFAFRCRFRCFRLA